MSWERKTVVAGGFATSYLEGGDGARQTVLLLHDGAFGSDAESCWTGFFDRFTPDYHVVAPDLLGYGATRKIVAFDRDPITFRLEHVQAFCAELGLKRPIAIGSSFGGGMVLRAASMKTLPLSAGVTISGPGGIFMNVQEMGRLQNYQPTEEWSRAVMEAMVTDPSPEDVRDRLERSTRPGHYECLAAARISSPVAVTGPDWREGFKRALATTDIPILLISGSEDPLLDADWARKVADLIPAAEAKVIPGGRHQPHVDDPKQVYSVISDFLARNGL